MIVQWAKKLQRGPIGDVYRLLKKVKNRIHKYRMLRWVYPRTYAKYAKQPVNENKVVFIEIRLPGLTNSFKLLYDEIVKNYTYEVHSHFLRNTFVPRKEYEQRCREMMQDIATAKYVFVNEGSNVVSCIKVRPETIVTQTWHGCGAFKKFGFSTADLIFGDTRAEMNRFPFYKNYTNLTLSSPEIAWAYEEAMNLSDRKEVIKPIGTSRTDVFYDQTFIQHAYDKLHHVMPESVGKKVILYAPTFRGRVAKAQAPDMLNVEMFRESLGEDYVLLMKYHPLVRKPPVIPADCQAFAQDLTDAMSIEELLSVSDICISDYSSLVFEYSLFEKPMIFFSYDLSEYFDWRGFYYDYNELTPGPVFKTNLEMIDYIQHIEERFDKQRVVDFRNKFMSACDGHATERIMELVFGDSMAQHRRPIPLEGEFHMVPNADVLYSDEEKRLNTLHEAKKTCRKQYREYAQQPVQENKVVLLYETEMGITLARMEQELQRREGLTVTAADVSLNKLPGAETMREIAAAQYIVLAAECTLVSLLNLREETKVVQLWDKSFPFRKFGYSTRAVIGGLRDRELEIAPLHGRYDLVPVASDEFVDIYRDAFRVKDAQSVQPLGAASTDVLFDEDFRRRALEKLYQVFPEAKEKKLIFYLPSARYTLTRPKKWVFIDHMYMNEYLGKDYAVVYYNDTADETLRKQKPKLAKYYTEFLHDATEEMTITELMAIADIMIGDYREEIFTFAATERPVFLYAPDYRTYFYQADTYYAYEDIAPGPVFSDGQELTRAIADLSSYDFEKLRAFRQKYLTNCDGHSVERIVDAMLR